MAILFSTKCLLFVHMYVDLLKLAYNYLKLVMLTSPGFFFKEANLFNKILSQQLTHDRSYISFIVRKRANAIVYISGDALSPRLPKYDSRALIYLLYVTISCRLVQSQAHLERMILPFSQ